MVWAIDPVNAEDDHCQGAESRAGDERDYGSMATQDEDSHRSCLLGVFGTMMFSV